MKRTILLLGLAACAASDGDDKAGPGDDELPEILGPDEVLLDDEDDGLHVEVVGGNATGWKFGFARPSQDWYDETCREPGDLCHTLGAEGGVVEWKGTFCDDPEDGETCIPRLYFRTPVMTFVLKPEVGLGCWTWGETDYYEGCTVTDWEEDGYDG